MRSRFEKGFRRTLIATAVNAALYGVALAQVQAGNAAETGATSNTDSASAEPTVVVVTGARAALARALDLKRNADVIQDSISATELGRFPDDNVADSLTHIAGISVSRTRGGEGQYINVRGLGSGYNIVTLNRRILATDGDGRDFAFDVLPSEMIGGADVMKSASASQMEGSIGGSVNLRSARPFDNPGYHASARIEGDRNDLSRKNGVKLSGVVSNTFNDNKMGFILGAVLSDREVRTDSLGYQTFNADSPGSFDVDGNGSLGPGEENLLGSCCISFGSIFEKKKRAALTGAFEWKVTPDFRMTFDALATRLDSPQVGYQQSYYVEHAADRWSDVVARDGLITGMTIKDLVPEMSNVTTDRKVDTMQVGWKGEWKVNRDLRLVGDVYRSTSKRDSGGKDTFVVAGIGGANTGYYKANDNAFPDIRVTLEDGRDLATELAAGRLGNSDYGVHFAGLTGVDIKDTVDGGSLEGRLSLDGKWNVDAFEFGVSGTSRSKKRTAIGNEKNGGACQYCDMYSTTFANLGANVVRPMNLPNYMRGAGGNFPGSFVAFDVPAYFEALKALDGKPKLDADGNPTGEFYDVSKSQPEFVPTQSYDVREKTATLFGQFELSGERWNGNVGVRVVHTKTRSKSAIDDIISINDPTPEIPTSSPDIEYSEATPVSQDGSYTKVLPSANFSYWMQPDLVLRAAMAKVMARPSLDRLAPTRTDNTLDRSYILNIDGDPNLKPTEATQQDLSLEWYYQPKSALNVALFAKQIKNFVTFQTDEKVDIGVPGYLYTVTRPVNGDKARVRGMELGVQHLWDNGFGIAAKFAKTWTKAYSGGEYVGQLEGVAPTASSLGFLYEKGKINAALTFDYTGKYTQSTNVIAGFPSKVDAITWVTASASYDLNKNVTLFVEGKNLGDEVMRSNLGRSDAIYGFEAWGRTYAAGMSVKF
ncbi:TonB-dependent receptor [Telluria beijingensis]|uniref:TonB-dependent receptor n=1 Tax=Telluria beijingensis TaxID=3068633 RepID=UPI002795A265|nr:TonB-dependent receptor [Massilia sp. REN29]